jgi:DNA-binding NarL/FixJ family response regulator
MKVMFVSTDSNLIEMLMKAHLIPEDQVTIYNESDEPLEVMSSVCSCQPAVLIIDDDFIKPNSVQILRSIRRVNQNVKIVFITSDTGIELGRDITPLGIHYYGIKPLNDKDLGESIRSLVTVYKN